MAEVIAHDPITDIARRAGWLSRPLGDLFDVQQGKAVSQRGRALGEQRSFLRTKNVLWGTLDLGLLDEMGFLAAEVERLRLRRGDLLTCEGGEIGRTAQWLSSESDVLFQNHLHRLRRKNAEVVPAFVMFWLEAAFTQLGFYGGVGNKTTIANLASARLKQLLVPLPERSEQIRIASALLHARDVKVAAWNRLLEVERAAARVLEAMFIDARASGSEVPLAELLDDAQYGISQRGNVTGSIPILRMNCQEYGLVHYRDLQFVDVSAPVRDAYTVNVGDILFNRTNSLDLVGRTAVVVEARPAIFASYLLRLRVHDGLPPWFLNAYLNLPSTQAQLRAMATRGVSQSNISASKLKTLPVLLPLAAQRMDIAVTAEAFARTLMSAKERATTTQSAYDALLRTLMTAERRLTNFPSELQHDEAI